MERSASITGSVLSQNPRSSRSWPCSLPASSQPSVFRMCGVDPTGGYTEQTSEHGPSSHRLRGSRGGWQAPLGRSSPVTLWSSVVGPCESGKPGWGGVLEMTQLLQAGWQGRFLGKDSFLEQTQSCGQRPGGPGRPGDAGRVGSGGPGIPKAGFILWLLQETGRGARSSPFYYLYFFKRILKVLTLL